MPLELSYAKVHNWNPKKKKREEKKKKGLRFTFDEISCIDFFFFFFWVEKPISCIDWSKVISEIHIKNMYSYMVTKAKVE